MSDEQESSPGNGGEVREFQFSMRTMLLVVTGFAVVMGLIAPIYRFAAANKANYRLMDETRAAIVSLPCPADVPKDQWQRAVDWTSNLVCQVYCSLDKNDPDSLPQLREAIAARAEGPVDLATLQWIWDEVENAPREVSKCATRFRDVRLLTKGPITDDDLPHLWGLRRCRYLYLDNTQITDAGLKDLEDLSNLERLLLDGTGVTEAE